LCRYVGDRHRTEAAGIETVDFATAQLYVTDTTISNTGTGISMQTTGLLLAVIDHTNVFNVATNGITTGGANGIAVNRAKVSRLSSFRPTPPDRFNGAGRMPVHNDVHMVSPAPPLQLRIQLAICNLLPLLCTPCEQRDHPARSNFGPTVALKRFWKCHIPS
jgi:hypothetical protein